MEHLIDSEHGIATLLATIAAVGTMHLIVKVGEFVWEMMRKKNELSEQSVEKLSNALMVNTQAVQKLETSVKEIEKDLAEIPKFKKDLRRLFAAVKIMAGDAWTDIRQEIMEDDLGGP